MTTYSSGHKSKGPGYSVGKAMSKTAMPQSKVAYSAGKNMDHATSVKGDPKGAPVQGKGK